MAWNRLVQLGTSWVVLFAAGSAWAQSTYRNDEVGYQVLVPKDYAAVAKSVPLGGLFGSFFPLGDPYRIDSFSRERGIAVPDSFFTFDLQMATFFFPAEGNPLDDRAEEDEEEGEGKVKVRFAGDKKIYRNFRDYASDKIRGFFFSAEKPVRMAGRDATLYEMKFEKLTEIEQRWVACAYPVENGEFALLFTCTDKHLAKYLPSFTQSFRSFKTLSPEGLRLPDWEGIRVSAGLDKPSEDLSAEELAAWRVRRRTERFEKEIAKLEKGWRHLESDHFLILTHVDPAFTETVRRQAESVRSWLEEVFGSVLEGYVEHAILRIFEDAKDAGWETGSGSIRIYVGGGAIDEIPVLKRDDFRDQPFEMLNREVMRQWFWQKNPELWIRMAEWLQTGLEEYLSGAALKGRRLVFPPDSWDRRSLAEALTALKRYRKDPVGEAPLLDLRDLFHMTSRDLFRGQAYSERRAQSSCTVRFLLEGPGRRWEKTKNLVEIYLANLLEEVRAVESRLDEEREEARKRAGAGMTEEDALAAEDEEYRKKRKNAFDKVEKEILEKAFEKTFRDWTEKDWGVLQRSWEEFADKVAT